MGTCSDVATILFVLASHLENPILGHLDAVKNVGCYLKSTADDLGLLLTYYQKQILESSFIFF